METNESILTRSIVGLDERKVLGKMSSLRVDYDTQAVSHYIVMNASTNNAIALPFENAIAVGDTFITVQSYGSFVDANSPASKELVSDSNKLVGVEVYSRTGNTLGTVAAFDFDPIFGAIKSITLDNGSEFKSDVFLFFAPDFVFVDDGSKTAADLRQAEDSTSDAPAAAPASAPATQAAPAAQPAAPAANADGLSNEDALLLDFLIGKTLNDDVANADDTFALPKGTEITREIALDAKKHDALLLLTMSVDSIRHDSSMFRRVCSTDQMKRRALSASLLFHPLTKGTTMDYQTLQDEIKSAMKAHDNNRRDILRQVHTELKAIEVNERRDITEADVDAMLKRVIKQTKETLDGSIKAGNNQERTDTLTEQVAILEGYLPEQVEGEALMALIDEVVAETGATTKKDMGRVMGALTQRTGGNFNKAAAAATLNQRLS